MDILRFGCRRICPLMKNVLRLKSVTELASVKMFRSVPVSCQIHTSPVAYGLDEFFDEENFDAEIVSVGRPWRREELRIKSNQDLHKLWYVLLKERNQLMTMEAMFHDKGESLPNPDRMEKVEESMENLLDVVKERNEAFEMFEYGRTTDPKTYTLRNFVGLPYKRTAREHYVPKHLNKRFNLMHINHEPWMDKHLARYEEKFRVKRKQKDKKHETHKKNLAEEFELSEEEVNELVGESPEHIDDPLDEYLKLTGELNDVKRHGR